MARGARGAARALVNEAEVIAALGVRPEDVLHPETSPVDHIRAVLGRAKLVVAVEGSAVMHAFLGLRSGAGVLVIQPPHRFNALARFYMNGVDIAYGFCVADPRPGGMHQPLDRLARLRDRMLDRIDGPGWPG